MSPPRMPHAYPFRFVDRVVEDRDETFSKGRVELAVSAGQWAASGATWGSSFLLAEVIAQSVLLLEGGDPEIGKTGFLAGLDNFSAARPPLAGERLTVAVRLTARYGPVVKFAGVVSSAGEEIARGEILVRRGQGRP